MTTGTSEPEEDINKEAAANAAFYLSVLKDLEGAPLTRVVTNVRIRHPKRLRTR